MPVVIKSSVGTGLLILICGFGSCSNENKLDVCKPNLVGGNREDFRHQQISTVTHVVHQLTQALVNTELSQHYDGLVPKTTTLMDYPASGRSLFQESTLVIKFDTVFETVLPASLRNELANRNLLGKGLVDIFLNVQANTYLGETEDHLDGSPLTTRLKAHAWADPDAPSVYSGTRLNRTLKIGIFESDFDISDEVKIGTLLPFTVFTHDSVFSPRTGRIKLGNGSPSQSFWTLTIDDKVPNCNRANVTLHWILTATDNAEFERILYENTLTHQLSVKNVDDLLVKLSQNSVFRDKSMLQKLTSLFH